MKEQEAEVAGCSEGNVDLNIRKKALKLSWFSFGTGCLRVCESLASEIFKNQPDE